MQKFVKQILDPADRLYGFDGGAYWVCLDTLRVNMICFLAVGLNRKKWGVSTPSTI